MTDVFISYRRSDREKAEKLAKNLKDEGLDVWWDAGLQAGEAFDEKIQELLQTAKAILVLWSPDAVASEWVRGEATIGRERGVLTPVMVRSVVVPVPFNLIQTPDLTDWNGDRLDPTYQALVARLRQLAAKTSAPLKRPPTRALRRLWTALAAVAVLAAGGASLWVFKPWEPLIEQADPLKRAAKAREAAFVRLATFGVTQEDVNRLDWRSIAQKRFKRDTFPQLKIAADGGDTLAQALICSVYYWGAPPVAISGQEAWNNCRRSAEAGDPVGQLWFGFLNRDNSGEQAAAEWIKKASDQGYVWAQYEYAACLENGVGVEIDIAKAIELYTAAQAKGLPNADLAMGANYIRGVGVGRDRAKGEALVTKAADSGVPFAMYYLASIYMDDKDYDKARRWYKAAAASESEQIRQRAENMLQTIDKDIADQKAADEAAAKAAATPAPASAPKKPSAKSDAKKE